MGRKARTPAKCLVCGDNACGINYNVPSCMSCKTFFRRNAPRQKEAICQFSDCCTLNRITRKFCTKCRLKKCFEVGMSKEMIKSEDEKHKLQEKIRFNRNKRLEDSKNMETKIKTLSPGGTATLTPNTSSSTSKTLCTESALVAVDSTVQPVLLEPNKESTIYSNDMLDSYEIVSTLDDICPFLKGMSPVELSAIEVVPLDSGQQPETNQLVPFVSSNSEFLTNLGPTLTKSNSLPNLELKITTLSPMLSSALATNFSSSTSETLSTESIVLPGTLVPNTESAINCDDMLDSYETSSTLDDICPYLKNMDPIELSDIEVTPLGCEQQPKPNQLLAIGSSNSEHLTNLVSNSSKSNSIINFEPDFAHLIPYFTTINHIGLPVDELILPEQKLVLELVSASCVMHNPYKRIVNFEFGGRCHEISEYTFYRLIRMSKKLTAFGQLTSESQEQLLKNSLIPMLFLRTVVMYNQYRKAWALVNDRSKSSVMFRLDTIKPYCNWGFERQENFPKLFRDEWKQDKAIMDLLTAIVLFSPSVNYREYDKIHSEHHRYIRLLHRYLRAKYSTNSEADGCFHQLMNNLQECQLLAEDLVSFFSCAQLEFRCRPFFCKLLDLDNQKYQHLMERQLTVWTDKSNFNELSQND